MNVFTVEEYESNGKRSTAASSSCRPTAQSGLKNRSLVVR